MRDVEELLIQRVRDLEARLARVEAGEYVANAGLLSGLHADATGAADAHVVATDASGDAKVVDLTASGGLNVGTATGAGTGDVSASGNVTAVNVTATARVTGTTGLRSGSVAVNDDAVLTLTGVAGRGVLVVFTGATANEAAVIHYRTGTSPHCLVMTQPAAVFEASTSTLSGTTGTDGKITVSAISTAGTVYIENRTGTARTVTYTFIG